MLPFQKKTWCFIFIGALFPFLSSAQNIKEWSLQQCIEYAIKNNIQIQQAQLNTEILEETLLQSKASVLPSVNGSAAHNYNFGRTINPFTNEYTTSKIVSQNFGLSGSMNLFNGLQSYNAILQNQLNYIASKYDVDKAKNDISLNVATAYLQILFNEELVAISKNQVELTQAQVKRTQLLLDLGATAKSDLLNIQSQLASEELSATNSQNQLELSYLSLVQLLNLDSVNDFTITKPKVQEPSETLLNSNPNQIYSSAVSQLPEIKSAEYKWESAKKGFRLAKGNISPQLTLNGSYGTSYSNAAKRIVGTPNYALAPNGSYTSLGDPVLAPMILNDRELIPFNNQVNDNINKSIGLRLTVPIFNGLQTKTTISKAKIQLQNAQLSLDLAKNNLRKTIQQAYADANAALKKYFSAERAVDAIEESFKYTEQKFNLGAINSIEYNDMKNKLIKSLSDLLQAKYDYIFKTKVLDFYQGKPLSL